MSKRIGPWWWCAGSLVLSAMLLVMVGAALAAARPRAMEDFSSLRLSSASAADRDSEAASLNGDGNLVAFHSDSDMLGQGIPDGQFEVWLYDTAELTLTRVTTASAADRDSYNPILNAAGTLAAFSSDSDFAIQGIAQGQREVWLYDLVGLSLTRVTTATDSSRVSWVNSMSADGSILAMSSDSDFLNQGIPAGQWEIWLVDTNNLDYTRVTTAADSSRSSHNPSLNADGTLVAFSSDADWLGEGIADEQSEIWLYDTSTLIYTRVTSASDSTRASYAPFLSADGSKLAFISDSDFLGEGNPQGVYEIWLYDVTAETLTRVTESVASRISDYPVLTADGSVLYFHGDADLLGEGIPNDQYEIWRYDVATAELTRVTEASDAFRDNYQPAVNADGTLVAFQSDSDFADEGIAENQFEVWLFTYQGPGVSLVKTADPEILAPGQSLTFTLVVHNPLTTTLTGATVSDTLPAELLFVGPVSLDPPQAGATLADDPGDLPLLAGGLTIIAGSSITLTVPTAVAAEVDWGTAITNTASITSTEIPTPAFGSATVHVLFSIIDVEPAPSSHAAPLAANLYLTANDAPRITSVTADTVVVHSAFQGWQDGLINVSDETISVYPYQDFMPGELVQTSVTDGILNRDDASLQPYVWQFRVATQGGEANFLPHPETPELQTIQTGDVGLGDLDGDGDLDAVLPSSFEETSVWLNDGVGNFALHGTTPTVGAASAGRAVALGDLDGNGTLDLVQVGAVTGTVWLNDGAGNLAAHPTTPEFETNASWNVVLGDIDADGDQDAIVARAADGSSVWVNDGLGNLSPHATTPVLGSGNVGELAMGDLDSDGDLDLLAGYRDYRPIFVWLNDGTGDFQSEGSFGPSGCFGLAAGDLDNDGDLDAVSVYLDALGAVWLNDGAGRFGPHPTTPSLSGTDGMDVALGDLDGDGDLDALIARRDLLSQTVWVNDGDGALTPGPLGGEFGGGNSTAVGLGDLDGDGDLDAMIGDYSGLNTTIWHNDAYSLMLPLLLKGS